MNLTLQISNADENLLKALKSVINLHPQAKLKVKRKYEYDDEPTEETREALMNPESLPQYTSHEQLIQELQAEIKAENANT